MLELFHLTHFSTIFGQLFASFTPAVGSMTTYWLELIVLRYVYSEETKIC